MLRRTLILIISVAAFGIAVALVVGVVSARSVATYWGLPTEEHYFSYHPDEIFLLLPAFGFAQGDWNPHFFNYGTLYIYLVGIPAVLLGTVSEAARFPDNLRPLYQLARSITMWMGIATVALVPLAFRWKDRWLGVLAATLLALCPLHIVSSGYATVDVPATFWLTLAFVLALRGADALHWRWAAAAGLAVGLGAATKYNAALFLIPTVVAPLLCEKRSWRWTWGGAVIGGAVVGFIIGCPFFWTPEFLRGLLFEAQHARVGGTLAFVGTGSGWVYHLIHGLPVGLGYPLLAAAVLGIVAALRLGLPAPRLSLLWVAFYLLAIGFGKERFIRYLVPLTPFLCILAATGIVWLYRSSNRLPARIPSVVLAVAVIGLTLVYGLGRVSPSSSDPRRIAWWESGLADMDIDARPTVGLVQAPWFYHPPVSPFNAGPFSRPLFEEWNLSNGEPVLITGWDAVKLDAERPDIFFLSDLESQDLLRLRNPEAIEFVAALDRLYQGRRGFGYSREVFWWLAPGRKWAPPDWLYQSPRITMYYNPQ